MTARYASTHEIEHWNDLLIKNPDSGNVFGSIEFAWQKQTGGYKPLFVIVDDITITVLEKSFPMLGKLWYLPKGPGVKSPKQVLGILEQLAVLGSKRGVFAIRIEPELPAASRKQLEKYGLIRTKPIIPNPSTITLDISKDAETLLTSLPQKSRHAIRRAERDGVSVSRVDANSKNCKIMYKLLSETAKGQFGIRSYQYYKSFWQRFEASKMGQMFFAYYDSEVVAGAYAMTMGTKSTYKDGASIRKRTAYGASHLLQWQVILWAKDQGATIHDFCGSPPSDKIGDSSHPHYGVGLFKQSFSKNVVDYVGCYDYTLRPIRHKLWLKVAERVAIRLHYYKHHDSYF
jgi:lipid II:glycine glycyltransferase (peptidoglycan interpeptide bridge formation enzyme)